jgi:nitrite reductase (NO-forming)
MVTNGHAKEQNAWPTVMVTFVFLALLVSCVSLAAVIHKTNDTTTVVASSSNAAAALATPPLPITDTPPAGFKARDPKAPAPSTQPAGTVHKITMTMEEKNMEIAPGVSQMMWTFDGTVPGPVLRGKVGDTFDITLVNHGSVPHSIDFHASKVAWNKVMRPIGPGQSANYTFKALRSGIFMYHCGAPPVIEHIGMGMYGAIIIDPPNLPPVDHEYVMLQSELYRSSDPTQPAAIDKMLNEKWDAVVFNGYPNQYQDQPIDVNVGDKIRVWVLDDGPSENSSFHVIGTIFDTTYKEGAYLLRPGADQGGSQALDLQPAQGGFVEFSFDQPGLYPFVTHKFASASKGALGVFAVGR